MERFVRYTTPDDNGETRAKRNERFGKSDLTPSLLPPDDLRELVGDFKHLTDVYGRVIDGSAHSFTYRDIADWMSVSWFWRDVLIHASLVWRQAMNKEISEMMAVQREGLESVKSYREM